MRKLLRRISLSLSLSPSALQVCAASFLSLTLSLSLASSRVAAGLVAVEQPVAVSRIARRMCFVCAAMCECV